MCKHTCTWTCTYMYVHACMCAVYVHMYVYTVAMPWVTVVRGCMDRCVYIAVERGCVHTCISLIPRLSSVCMHALLWCKGQQTNVCSRGGASPGYLHGYIIAKTSSCSAQPVLRFPLPPNLHVPFTPTNSQECVRQGVHGHLYTCTYIVGIIC